MATGCREPACHRPGCVHDPLTASAFCALVGGAGENEAEPGDLPSPSGIRSK
ncbi:hypothetical protein T492DRAFT_895058 [Pavlovales sp. CCMP2436]|nr:hypothetical protein T492DRAFT_895058 [Pavlovales sp. CCMP2436]